MKEKYLFILNRKSKVILLFGLLLFMSVHVAQTSAASVNVRVTINQVAISDAGGESDAEVYYRIDGSRIPYSSYIGSYAGMSYPPSSGWYQATARNTPDKAKTMSYYSGFSKQIEMWDYDGGGSNDDKLFQIQLDVHSYKSGSWTFWTERTGGSADGGNIEVDVEFALNKWQWVDVDCGFPTGSTRCQTTAGYWTALQITVYMYTTTGPWN